MSEQNFQMQQAVNDALAQEKKKKKKKKLIILAIILVVIIVIGAISAGGSSNSDDSSSSGAVGSSNSIEAEKKEKTEGEIGKYVCTVKSAEICKNWEGKDAVKITYSFTNNNSEAESFDVALTDEVYQDGIGLESTFISSDDDDWGIDVKIKTGTTKDVAKVYLLRDKTTPLEVEIGEWISFDDTKLTYNIELQ